MSIGVFNRSFDTIFSTNSSFLKANENDAILYKCDLFFSFNFTSSSNDLVQFSGSNELTRVNGAWGEKGFVIGDSVGITYTLIVDPQDSSQDINVNVTRTITDINGNVMTLSSAVAQNSNMLGATAPSTNQLSSVSIVNNTRSVPETLTVFANLVSNDSQGTVNSLIDGEVNRFRFLGIDGMSTGATITATQLGERSGGAFDSQITLTRGTGPDANRYSLEMPFYNWLRYEQAQPTTKPNVYDANDSIKLFTRFEAKAEENNPNAIIVRNDNTQLGNVGWIGENYNQGVNNFTLTSFANEDDNGNPISGFDYGQPNNITITVETSQTTIDDKAIVLIQHLPINGYKNNQFNFNENTLSAYSIAEDSSTLFVREFAKNGAQLNITSASVSTTGNELTYQLRVVPNANYTAYMDDQDLGDRFVKITIQCISDGLDDAAVVVASQGQADAQPPVGQLAQEVQSLDFFNHAMELADTPLFNLDFMTEDDILVRSIMNFNKSDNYDAFRVLFQVVRQSDGAFFNLFSRTINLTQYPITNAGVRLINYNEALNYQLPNPDRNVLTLQTTGVETSTTYEVELIHTLLLNWRYWQAQPNALADFLDATLPNNGLNDEWVRYAVLGYEFRLRLELIKDGIADFFNSQQILIADYDSGVTTVIEFEDMDGNPIPAPLSNQQFKVIATHTAPTPWDANDLWGWIAQRPLESEPRRLISTAWAWTSQNNPLLPEQGQPQATLTVNGNDAIITAICDGTQLPSNVTFVSRIQSPVRDECQSPIEFLFEFMDSLSGSKEEQFNELKIILRTGEFGAGGLCCPECFAQKEPQNIKAMAFGSISVIDNNLPPWWTQEFCCQDIYKVEEDCTANFNDQIDAIYAGIEGDIGEFEGENLPTQVNPYFHSNWELLGQLIFNFTTDEKLRYDIVSYFILNGVVIYCTPDGTTLFQTLNID